MKIETFSIQGPVLFTPEKHGDSRGFFAETFKANIFEEVTGAKAEFVQDNLSVSDQIGTLRGLHYQAPPHAQGKLVSCQGGRIMDVIVDARKSSPTYGQHLSVDLSDTTRAQLWVPPSFLHGYVTRSAHCEVMYKVTNYYAPQSEGSVIWNDPQLGIDWGLDAPVISKRDQSGEAFAAFESPFS
ncbi:dTDP-4-dehydrorhamnose 3,5-epimerase [Hellea balneolensis]|uniref:dTDP-4-dehydrorhamnose 3,5-epimerase n=1 Tax=Hellea balneolensis TaxID=287478 RepID=UPI0003FBB672|nr:dTDP-4-dehydrorhamnose 3,5-epimerase [Hellea balneolensis]